MYVKCSFSCAIYNIKQLKNNGETLSELQISV